MALVGSVLLALVVLGSPLVSRAARGATTATRDRTGPAQAQFLTPRPIEPVAAAVRLARERAPIPATLNPSTPAGVGAAVASGCLPSFGPGTTYQLCSLGAVHAAHTVVLLGDSHASMWTPAFVQAAVRLDFRLVPLAKPGCALWALHENRPGWPCLSWWRGVLRELAKLRPSATVVSFLTGNYTLAQAGLAARLVERVMQAVPHPVLLADPPSDDWYVDNVPTPSQCMSAAGANLGRCALHVTPAIRASLTSIQAMVDRHGYPAIPTLQWFCDQGICPTVIDGTVTSEDGNHVTPQYARLLAPRLTQRLRPVLRALWNAERDGTSGQSRRIAADRLPAASTVRSTEASRSAGA